MVMQRLSDAEKAAGQREIALKILRDAEREIRELYPKMSGHKKRKKALKLAEARMRAVAEAGDAQSVIASVTGEKARIVVD